VGAVSGGATIRHDAPVVTLKESPYWWDTVPSEAGSSNLDVLPSRRFDVAVIGAGYTGLAAARQLARVGASVVVLERERVGWGASSRNGGQVLTGLKLDPATLVSRAGESRARELFDISLESIAALEALIAGEAIECEYERTGHIQAASKRAHFDAFREEQKLLARVFEHRVELVPRAEQRREIASDAYHGLLVDERSAALNPAQYVRGLNAAAVRGGVVVAEGTGVERLTRQSMRWAIATSRGGVDARDVLVATNGYTDGAAPALQRRLVPIGSYVIATAPLPASIAATLLPRRRVAFDSKHFLHYFRLTRDSRLLFGGRAEFARPTRETTRRAAAILRRDLARVFPQLAATRLEYAWSGNVAFTRDRMPHAGRLDETYYAGGYCGHGIAMATYLGALVARRIAGEPVEHPLLSDSFPAIPLYRGKPWFLPVVGAYYKLRDWMD
jgi:glycine/D-amino acid oxidase-like deaminating enzyme